MKRTNVVSLIVITLALVLSQPIYSPPAGAQPVELLVNGGFETGNFAGWTAFTTGSPFGPWRVDRSGFRSNVRIELQDVQSWNGFEGFDP
jgi:hypothetical protein